MKLPEIYCSCGFLQAVQNRYIHHLQNEVTGTEDCYKWADSAYDLLFNQINLVIDISENELIRRSTKEKDIDYNPHLKRLWKHGTQGRTRYNPNGFPLLLEKRIESNSFPRDGFFISIAKEVCENHLNKSGILCCCIENMDAILPELITKERKSISKNSTSGWSFLKNFKFPHDSLIISDNYFLKDERIIKQNLFEILGYIMPISLDHEYDLCIFTSDSNQLKKFSLINDFLGNKFNYKTNLSIVCPKGKKLHDRYIISNYSYIESLSGFDLFQDKKLSKESTRIEFCPITNIEKLSKGPRIFEFHSQLVSDFSKLYNETPEKIGSETLFVGYKKHRLLLSV